MILFYNLNVNFNIFKFNCVIISFHFVKKWFGISIFFTFFRLYSQSRVHDLSLFAWDTLVGLPVGTIDILETIRSFSIETIV